MAKIVNTDGGKRPRTRGYRLKLMITILLIGAVMVGGGLYVGFVWKPWQGATTARRPAESKYSYNTVTGNLDESSYAKAVEQLDGEANQATDTNEKLFAYFQQYSLALKMKKYNEALRYAQLADNVKSYSETSAAIAVSYASMGDKQQAIVYYKKAVSQLDQSTEGGRTDARSFTSAITELGG